MNTTQVRPASAEDRAAAERAARALNEYYAARGKVINARACPRTGFVFSDLSKPDALPSAQDMAGNEPPKSTLIRVQEFFEAHPTSWFRPLYLRGALKICKPNLHVALSTLHNAGIIQRRPAALVGGRAVEYALTKGVR